MHPATLRRDIALLAVAAAGAVSSSVWVHHKTCAEHAEVVPVVTGVAERPQVARPTTPAPLDYGEHVAFVIDLEEPYVVLATHVEASWEGELGPLLGVDTVFRDVDLRALPESIRALLGGEVGLWTTEFDGSATRLGTARVGRPRLVAQAAGALGADFDTWSLHEQIERDGHLPPQLEARVGRAIWSDGVQLLVAPLEGPRASEATWARSALLEDPMFLSPVSPPRDTVASMRRTFLSDPAGRLAAEAHERHGFGPLEPHVLVKGWRDATGVVKLSTAFVDSPHVDECGGFDHGMALARSEAHGTSVLPTHHTAGPSLVADFNGDGFVDILFEPRPLDGDTTIVRGTADGFEVVEALAEVPYFGCRC